MEEEKKGMALNDDKLKNISGGGGSAPSLEEELQKQKAEVQRIKDAHLQDAQRELRR